MKKFATIISIMVADKGFDINKFYEFLKKQGIRAIIPVKKNVHKGFFRNFMCKFFRTHIPQAQHYRVCHQQTQTFVCWIPILIYNGATTQRGPAPHDSGQPQVRVGLSTEFRIGELI